MSTDQVSVALAGVLDALTLVQEQLDALTESSQRIETTHREIVNRLDTIGAGQAAVTDLTPILEMKAASHRSLVIPCAKLRLSGSASTR